LDAVLKVLFIVSMAAGDRKIEIVLWTESELVAYAQEKYKSLFPGRFSWWVVGITGR